jgi:hypothetical protein
MAFLVAVPVIALEVGLRWYAILAAGAIAYLLVIVVEAAVWREGREERTAVPAAAVVAAEPPATNAEHVRVLRPEPEPGSEPEAADDAEPEPEAEVVHEPPRLVPVPAPEPPPAPAPAPEPEPELPPAATVVPIVPAGAPRQWNVWDLDQVARELAGSDPAADEERTFLLMYLRDFAGPDGLLPVDFDELVRQTFGEFVGDR